MSTDIIREKRKESLKKEGMSNESYQASNMEEQSPSERRPLTASEHHSLSKYHSQRILKAFLAIGTIGMLSV
jgi:hypothetical protein